MTLRIGDFPQFGKIMACNRAGGKYVILYDREACVTLRTINHFSDRVDSSPVIEFCFLRRINSRPSSIKPKRKQRSPIILIAKVTVLPPIRAGTK